MPDWLTITLSAFGAAVMLAITVYHCNKAVHAWRIVAGQFPDRPFIPQTSYKKLAGWICGMPSPSYSHTLEVNEDGLRVSVPSTFINRGLCQPLFFPWSAVRAIRREFYYFYPRSFKIEISGLTLPMRFRSTLWRHDHVVEELQAFQPQQSIALKVAA